MVECSRSEVLVMVSHIVKIQHSMSMCLVGHHPLVAPLEALWCFSVHGEMKALEICNVVRCVEEWKYGDVGTGK